MKKDILEYKKGDVFDTLEGYEMVTGKKNGWIYTDTYEECLMDGTMYKVKSSKYREYIFNDRLENEFHKPARYKKSSDVYFIATRINLYPEIEELYKYDTLAEAKKGLINIKNTLKDWDWTDNEIKEKNYCIVNQRGDLVK